MLTFDQAVLSAYNFPAAVLRWLPVLSPDQKQLVSHLAASSVARLEQDYLQALTPAQIVLATVLAVAALRLVLSLVYWLRSLTWSKVQERLFRLAMHVPMVQAHIDKEKDKTVAQVVQKFSVLRKGKSILALPEQGQKPADIMAKVVELNKGCRKYWTDGGHVSGAVYTADPAHWDFIADVMKHCIVTNPLHIDEFMYVTQCEAEIIRWTLNLYHGDQNACGMVTSGGTESIFQCVLAYREQAKEEKGITRPNMVMPETAHPAFDKACFYLKIECRKIPMTKDFRVDLDGMRRAIDSNTICLVASSPDYAYGLYEPVPQIAALAQSYGIGCHSDCCLGSFVNPFADELGFKLPNLFDFRVPGVTSVTADPHKYAYGPKGCSLALFRHKSLRNGALYCNSQWQGGLYATTCLAGSRPGQVIVGTWASMLKHGRKGLAEKARGILEAQKQARLSFANDADIKVISQHPSPVFSFTSDTVNCIAMGELLHHKRHWITARLQRPPAAHLAFTDASAEHWKDFVDAIRYCTKLMKDDKALNTNQDTAIYGMTGLIPDKRFLRQFIIVHQAAMLDTLE